MKFIVRQIINFTALLTLYLFFILSDDLIVNLNKSSRIGQVLVVFSLGNLKCPTNLYEQSYSNKFQFAQYNKYDLHHVKADDRSSWSLPNTIYGKIAIVHEIVKNQLSQSRHYDWIFWTDPDILIDNLTLPIQLERYKGYHLVVWSNFDPVNSTQDGILTFKAKVFLLRNNQLSWKFLNEDLEKIVLRNNLRAEKSVVYFEKSHLVSDYFNNASMNKVDDENSRCFVDFSICRLCSWRRPPKFCSRTWNYIFKKSNTTFNEKFINSSSIQYFGFK